MSQALFLNKKNESFNNNLIDENSKTNYNTFRH